jgi:hypothetical protein
MGVSLLIGKWSDLLLLDLIVRKLGFELARVDLLDQDILASFLYFSQLAPAIMLAKGEADWTRNKPVAEGILMFIP